MPAFHIFDVVGIIHESGRHPTLPGCLQVAEACQGSIYIGSFTHVLGKTRPIKVVCLDFILAPGAEGDVPLCRPIGQALEGVARDRFVAPARESQLAEKNLRLEAHQIKEGNNKAVNQNTPYKFLWCFYFQIGPVNIRWVRWTLSLQPQLGLILSKMAKNLPQFIFVAIGDKCSNHVCMVLIFFLLLNEVLNCLGSPRIFVFDCGSS